MVIYVIVFLAKHFGATDFINPSNSDKLIQDILIDMTDGGLDYTFECVGNVKTMVSKILIIDLKTILLIKVNKYILIESCIRSLS